MNRTQRRYKYRRPKSNDSKKKKNEIEEVLAPRSRRQMQTRCCYVTPDQRSFVQLTSSESPSQNQIVVSAESHRSTIPEQNTIAEPVRPISPEVITIAKPKRPKLPDMETVAKTYRPHRRTFSDENKKPKTFRTTRPDVRNARYKPTIPDMNMATDPLVTSDVNMGEGRAILPDLTVAQLHELRKVFFPPCHRTEKASQYVKQQQASYGVMSWQGVGNAKEIDKIILRGRDEGTLTQYHNLPKNLHISDTPCVKLMAVKFTKYKKDNIELRRLEEKVVCVEYDVFDKEIGVATPVQKMRAFFSIKPVDVEKAKVLTELPPTIKSKFNISTADLQKLNQKEIEIIDGKILENQPYLDDLRKLLRRKENAQNHKTALNLQALYDMGKRDLLDLNTNFDRNTMPKEELIEMQNFILQNCKSTAHGIRRTTIENNPKQLEELAQNTMSLTLMTELLRESNKNITQL